MVQSIKIHQIKKVLKKYFEEDDIHDIVGEI